MAEMFSVAGRQAAQAKSKANRETFQAEFGHGYDPAGFRGHTFYGYNCRECGIHIGMVSNTKGWAKHKGVWPGRQS